MSDDLISRKAVIEEVKRYRDAEYSNNDRTSRALSYVVEIIKNQPTAFDKEEVIGELVELRQREYNDSDDEPETLDGEEIYDEGRSQGRFEAYHRAIEIVEKGGIE
jgi:hypothetical protein